MGGTVLRAALAKADQANTTIIPETFKDGAIPRPREPNGRYRHGVKPGFHVDNRDGKSLAERIQSRRRFIPNSGPGNRIAVVCFADIVTVGRTLGFPEEGVPHYDIFRDYLRTYPDEAICVGIPVAPGEGTVVNTDLVVHDGMTLGTDKRSLTLQILGDWKRGGLARMD
jgi:hypothetical protein